MSFGDPSPREDAVPRREGRLRMKGLVDEAELREERKDRSGRRGEGGQIQISERDLKESRQSRFVGNLRMAFDPARLTLR